MWGTKSQTHNPIKKLKKINPVPYRGPTLGHQEQISNKKTSVCTRTRGESETSLYTVVHENVKVYVYEPVCKFFFEISLNFFKNSPQLIFL